MLRRVLLIYEEAGRRIDAQRDFPVQALADAAQVVRAFVEDYHEKSEEQSIFPRFEKAGKLTDLVKTLRAQHDAGRRITDEVTNLAKGESLKDPENRRKLAANLRAFTRMYRPHAAREDTVLFPAFLEMVSAAELAELGEKFEKEEERRFGEKGFEKMVERVAGIEKQFGIEDIARFTPPK